MPFFETNCAAGQSRSCPGDPEKRRAAFTLIELALAVFVMGVAVLGVFGLGRLGLTASTDAEDELRAAMFADDVFATLRIYSDAMQDTNRWEELYGVVPASEEEAFTDFWVGLTDWSISARLPDFWAAPENGPLSLAGDDELPYPIHVAAILSADEDLPDDLPETTNVFCSGAIRETDLPNIPEYSIRYCLTITTNTPYYVSANLNVWCGLDSRRRSDFTFYTHFYAKGRMP